MSKINKILLVVFGVVVLFLILNLTQNKSSQSKNGDSSSKNKSVVSQKGELSPQENEGGNVTVTVKPKVLKVGEKPTFEIEFNTHSVELSFDITQISSIVDEKGNVLNDSAWNGTPVGGHHREGTLIFNTPLPQTKYVELIFKNVSEVTERKFRWEL